MDAPEYEKKPTKKSLYYRKRCFGMTGIDRIQVAESKTIINRVKSIMIRVADESGSDIDEILDDLAGLQDGLIEGIRNIEEVDPRINDPLPKIERKYRTIASFEDTDIRQLFRFESKEQLQKLLTGFRFPDKMPGMVRNKFSGEEVLLCGIYRLHSVNVLGDAGWQEVFGMTQSVASMACNLFFEYMWKWWSYLLFDHMQFWVTRIPASYGRSDSIKDGSAWLLL